MMTSLKKWLFTFYCFAFLLYPFSNFAQKGNYIHLNGIYQYSSISNRNDLLYSDNPVNFSRSLYPGMGVTFINNSSNLFGFEVGAGFSVKGQNYYGTILYDANTEDTVTIHYNSEVKLNYLHFPLLIRFNSTLGEDVVFLTISTGFQLDYLINAKMNVDPAPVIPSGGEIEIRDLFNRANMSFLSNAVFSWKFSDLWLLNFGINMSRTLFNIENRNFPFDKSIHPVEYYFPVSTKKENRPSHDDLENRQTTRLMSYGVILGLSYLIKPL